jgi:hypothetical protein
MSEEPPKPIVDENGQVLKGREAEQYAMNATSRIEGKQIGKDLNLSRKGPLQNGRQNRGASLSSKIRDTQKEKDKKDKELRSAISHAQKALETSLAELTAELEKIDEGLNAIAKLKALRANGTFDKDNADHIVLMQNAGITSEEMESPEAGDILDKKEKDFHERREEVIKESKVLIQEAKQKGYTSEAINEFKEKLELTDSSIAYDIATNQDGPEELKETAGKIVIEDYDDAGLLDKDTDFFGSMSGTSVAKNNGIGETIKSKNGNLALSSTFTRASDPNPPHEAPKVEVALNLEVPKVV